MTKKWNNWAVFFTSVVLSLILALFTKDYYLNSSLFSGSSWIGGGIVDMLEGYINSFLLSYTFFVAFFYRAFSKNFKPIALIYFLALPFLLFISSIQHITAFLALLVVGLLLGHLVSKIVPRTG